MTNDYRIILPLMFSVAISLIISQRIQKDSVYALGLARHGIRLDRGRDIEVLQAITVGEAMQKDPATLTETDKLEDAAKIDGASDLQTFVWIILPLVAAGAVAAGITSIILCWNQFVFPLILTRQRAVTATVALMKFLAAEAADILFRHIIRLVTKGNGKFLTIHVGLGHQSTEPLSWERTIRNLRRLVQYGTERQVTVCLENLAWGWTSRPHLFEKLIRKSGAGVTFDIGHAYACESVVSHHYTIEDFVSPHPQRIFNAHVYHTELSGLGHVPPKEPNDLRARLLLLEKVNCPWWVIEIREPEALVHTKRIIDEYLKEQAEKAV